MLSLNDSRLVLNSCARNDFNGCNTNVSVPWQETSNWRNQRTQADRQAGKRASEQASERARKQGSMEEKERSNIHIYIYIIHIQ